MAGAVASHLNFCSLSAGRVLIASSKANKVEQSRQIDFLFNILSKINRTMHSLFNFQQIEYAYS
jgi:hypothetical protein